MPVKEPHLEHREHSVSVSYHYSRLGPLQGACGGTASLQAGGDRLEKDCSIVWHLQKAFVQWKLPKERAQGLVTEHHTWKSAQTPNSFHTGFGGTS